MDIYRHILSALECEPRVMLCTIINTSGSTPASALSKMLVKDGGKSWEGTVGGGCMEGDVLHAARRLFQSNTAEILTFQLNETNLDQGLICGGSLDILIEPLTRNDLEWLRDLQSMRVEGEDAVLARLLSSAGTIEWKEFVRPVPHKTVENVEEQSATLARLQSLVPSLQSVISAEVQKVHHRHQTRRLAVPEGELILEPVLGTPSLIIFGGGHVSKYVSRAASMAGFQVTVIDDRPEYANALRFPEAVQALAVEFTEAFHHISIHPTTYVVIVTRGHRSDEDILERVVQRPTKYIGMIGSKRKIMTTYEHLLDRGISAGALKRVHAPMGLEIGAVTAEEIAVSIVSELIAIRRGEESHVPHKSEAMNELIALLERHQTVV